MTDFNWKTWGIVFVIALGGTFEVIKRLPEGKAWNTENLRAPKIKPYAARLNGSRAGLMNRQAPPAMLPPPNMIRPPQPQTPPPMTKEQLTALMAAHAGKPGQTEFDGTDKAKKGKEDEWELVLDPKTGKMVKRKKKKKVAKKEKKEEKKEEAKVAEKKPEPDEDENKTDTEADIDAAITNALETGKLAPMPKNKADEPFASAEEWIKRLLNRPSLSETNRFIDHYRKNLVNSEVFYKVVNAMLADSRAEMKKLGIHAAAQIPNAMSFQVLAAAAVSSKNDGSVKAKAEEALNSYTNVSRVGILKALLRNGVPPAAAIKAAQLVKTSAEQNLGAQSSSSGGTAQSRNQTTFRNFRTVLDTLSKTATDAGVKAAATETLARLNDLLGGSSSTTAVAQQ